MIKHNERGDTMTVVLEGELDHHSAERMRTGLESLIASPHVKHLVLDLGKLSFMDSSGIGVVLGRYKTLARRGGSVAVRSPNAHVDRIFAMSGLYQIVDKL